MRIVFSCMAMREVDFFIDVGQELARQGHDVGFVNFFEPGDRHIEDAGFSLFSLQKARRERPTAVSSMADVEGIYGINCRETVLHEIVTRGDHDDRLYLAKLAQYLELFDTALAELSPDMVVQELGGFIAPLALYHACKRRDVPHFFIEPSPFPSRYFLTREGIDVQLSPGDASGRAGRQKQVAAFRKRYTDAKLVAIPFKDRRHFKDAVLSKFVNRDNLRKLRSKICDKYIARYDYEYDSILNYCLRHADMYLNRKRIGRYYSSVITDGDQPYFYFPFHVPLDFSLTVRANHLLDQINLVCQISRVVPEGYQIWVKEHPAGIGVYNRAQVRTLVGNSNVRMLDPSINSFDVIGKAAGVITINSKVGFEALLQRKPVFCLGRAFYRGQGITVAADDVRHLARELKAYVEGDGVVPDESALDEFLDTVMASTYPGELFEYSPENIRVFASSMIEVGRRI